jgi:hypothetical protein
MHSCTSRLLEPTTWCCLQLTGLGKCYPMLPNRMQIQSTSTKTIEKTIAAQRHTGGLMAFGGPTLPTSAEVPIVQRQPKNQPTWIQLPKKQAASHQIKAHQSILKQMEDEGTDDQKGTTTASPVAVPTATTDGSNHQLHPQYSYTHPLPH